MHLVANSINNQSVARETADRPVDPRSLRQAYARARARATFVLARESISFLRPLPFFPLFVSLFLFASTWRLSSPAANDTPR